ncbi:hypothetical protein [Bacteroides sp. UBA939]|uniref:hypothetical protein n=1 Tax=Bacteroides sp. UBA939 TaxID=1946092 RepID=UPI0039C87555
MESFRSPTPTTFRGKAIAIVQPRPQPGTIEIKVTAKGLTEGKITIEAEGI